MNQWIPICTNATLKIKVRIDDRTLMLKAMVTTPVAMDHGRKGLLP
jgi:hypothetical protein